MTTQVSETFEYRDRNCSIIDGAWEGPFDPAAHGLKVTSAGSACWRGYSCHYALHDNKLVLHTLAVALKGPAPDLFGVKPVAPGVKIDLEIQRRSRSDLRPR